MFKIWHSLTLMLPSQVPAHWAHLANSPKLGNVALSLVQWVQANGHKDTVAPCMIPGSTPTSSRSEVRPPSLPSCLLSSLMSVVFFTPFRSAIYSVSVSAGHFLKAFSFELKKTEKKKIDFEPFSNHMRPPVIWVQRQLVSYDICTSNYLKSEGVSFGLHCHLTGRLENV